MRPARRAPPALKRFGQHFLADPGILSDIANALEPVAGETVIEIGPGRGSLTAILARRAKRLLAIEIDRALAAALSVRYAGDAAVEIVEDDVLRVDLAALAGGPFLVVGNVPYYITTPIIFHVLREPLPKRAVFLVQKEVAERIVAPPGSRTYGALSVNVQAIASAEIVRTVPAGAFSPPPKVESALIRLTPRPNPLLAAGELQSFRAFVQAAFGMRRKQTATVLRSIRGLSADAAVVLLDSAGVDPRARPETLPPETFAALLRASSR